MRALREAEHQAQSIGHFQRADSEEGVLEVRYTGMKELTKSEFGFKDLNFKYRIKIYIFAVVVDRIPIPELMPCNVGVRLFTDIAIPSCGQGMRTSN